MTALLVTCPSCGRGVGEVCISGYSFAIDPHAERLEAFAQLDPLICRVCLAPHCRGCLDPRDLGWG